MIVLWTLFEVDASIMDTNAMIMIGMVNIDVGKVELSATNGGGRVAVFQTVINGSELSNHH